MTKRKSLSYLIEAEMEKATILMAASAITDKLQKVAEDLAKMGPNDVMPLADSMRDMFGAEQAASFEKAVKEKLDSIVEQVRDAHYAIADQIEALKNGEPMNDMAKADDDNMFGDTDDDAMGDMDAQDHADLGMTDGGDEMADDQMGGGHGEDDMSDLDSAFAGTDMGGAAGRPQKESFQRKGKKLDESSADHRLVKEFAGLLREGKSPAKAANMIADAYALDVSAVVDIITKVKQG